MDPTERKHYETPTSAEAFRGRFATHFFGLEIGQPKPEGKLPRNLRVESGAEGRVKALHYELWESPTDTFDVLQQELSARLGDANARRDGTREAVWEGRGMLVRLQERMLDPGRKLTLDVTDAPGSAAPSEDLEALEALVQDTFAELENVSIKRDDPQTLRVSADLRGDDFAGVLLKWTGPVTLDGGLQPAFVDRMLEELRHAQAEADDFEM